MLAARPVHLVAALCLLYCVAAQGGNYVDDGGFDYAEPAPPSRPAPRPAPAYRPQPGLSASTGPKPTPVPILKQINRHNEDGSYTYGYEGADGAFKIETKLANGEVMGKYGYVDDTGNVRVVEYGANKFGFQPAGEGITVPPPTLVDESVNKKSSKVPPQSRESVEYDDGQYYEEAPAREAEPPPPVRPAPRPAPRPAQRVASRPAPQPQFSSDDTYSTFSSTQNFGPSRPVSFSPSSPSFGPSQSSFAPSQSSLGPAPPRAAVPGAVPVGPAASYSQPRALSAPPRPVSRPQPQQQSFFAPVSAPAPVYETRSAPAAPSSSRGAFGRSASILDQLEKDFALPSNSAPALHDITFGSY